jgi:hypothetical protein
MIEQLQAILLFIAVLCIIRIVRGFYDNTR